MLRRSLRHPQVTAGSGTGTDLLDYEYDCTRVLIAGETLPGTGKGVYMHVGGKVKPVSKLIRATAVWFAVCVVRMGERMGVQVRRSAIELVGICVYVGVIVAVVYYSSTAYSSIQNWGEGVWMSI